MYIEEQQTRKVFGSDSTMGLFVALYLILLAFFIVLTAVSQQSASRASAAMESVNTVFREPGNSSTGVNPDALRSAQSDPVLIEIERAFSSAFDIKGQFAVAGGNIYQVQLPVEYLFEPGSFRVRDAIHSTLDELLQLLETAPAGQKQELALLFGSGGELVDRELTRSQEIAVRRSGSFARYMESGGFRNISAGFTNIPDGEILLIFRNAASRGVS